MDPYIKHVLVVIRFHLRLRLYLKYFKTDGIQSVTRYKAVSINYAIGENTGLYIRNLFFLLFIPWRLPWKELPFL